LAWLVLARAGLPAKDFTQPSSNCDADVTNKRNNGGALPNAATRRRAAATIEGE
jgi:hypothetical protein